MLESTSIDIESVEGLAVRIPDGASMVVAPDYSGCAMAVIRALICGPVAEAIGDTYPAFAQRLFTDTAA